MALGYLIRGISPHATQLQAANEGRLIGALNAVDGSIDIGGGMRLPLVFLIATIGSAQRYTIQTFAGGGPPENTLCTTADVFESSAIAARTP